MSNQIFFLLEEYFMSGFIFYCNINIIKSLAGKVLFSENKKMQAKLTK